MAIKIFRRDPEAKGPRGLLLEAQAAAQLRHDGIVKVHAVLEDGDGDEFLVLDYIQGTSLEAVLSQTRLSVDESARLMRDVAAAVQHAHDSFYLSIVI